MTTWTEATEEPEYVAHGYIRSGYVGMTYEPATEADPAWTNATEASPSWTEQ